MFLKDLLFPKICLGCGYLGSYICLECLSKLKSVRLDVCLYCQKGSPFGLTHPSCSKKLSIDGCLAFFYYEPLMKKIIKSIKYQLVKETFDELFSILGQQAIDKLGSYKNLFSHCFIQPIPLHPHRLQQRGFNQSQLIGEFLGKILKLPMGDFLERKKATSPLAQLKDKRQRYFKIRGAFLVKNKTNLLGKKIILVDDVITTGATVKEAGRILKKHGALKVFVIALAKG